MNQELKVSVIMPTYGGERYILRSVESILQNDYHNFELIVVDQSPTTAVEQLLAETFTKDSTFKYLHLNRAGASHARNVGFSISTGNLILFTDDDVVVTKGWISGFIDCYLALTSRGIKPGVMGGPVEGIWEIDRPLWWPLEYGFLICEFNMGVQRKEYEGGALPFSANIAFPRDVLESVGGFEEGAGPKGDRKKAWKLLGGEDTMCVLKVKEKGLPLYYEPNALVFHVMIKERLTRKYFLKRIFWEGCTQLNVRFTLYPESLNDLSSIARCSFSNLFKSVTELVKWRGFSGDDAEKTMMLQCGRFCMAAGELYWTCNVLCGRTKKSLLKPWA